MDVISFSIRLWGTIQVSPVIQQQFHGPKSPFPVAKTPHQLSMSSPNRLDPKILIDYLVPRQVINSHYLTTVGYYHSVCMPGTYRLPEQRTAVTGQAYLRVYSYFYVSFTTYGQIWMGSYVCGMCGNFSGKVAIYLSKRSVSGPGTMQPILSIEPCMLRTYL